MVTLESLKSLKETVDFFKIQLDDMLKVRSQEKMFNSSDEYYRAWRDIEYFPHDYFKFRLFDLEITLKYTGRKKHYFISILQLKKFVISFHNFYSFFKKYKLVLSPDTKVLDIPKNINFNDSIKIFLEFIELICKHYIIYLNTLFQ